MTKGTYQDWNKVDVKVENVIAELIDNSAIKNPSVINVVLRKDASKIRVGKFYSDQSSPTYINRSKSFTISVFDKGNGFDSVNDLHEAFEIVQMSGEEKKREDGESGLFHVGMKESTLNRFHHFSMITKIGKGYKHRSIIFPNKQNEFVYDWDPQKINLNPSDLIPPHVERDWILKYMEKDGYTTCAHSSAARSSLTAASEANDECDVDFTNIAAFANTIKTYLGIIYAEDLKNKAYELKVTYFDKDDNPHGQNVKPVDMFWDELTPEKIYRRKDDTTLSVANRYKCETMYGLGTFVGKRKEIKTDIAKRNVSFFVTPYLLPRDNIRREFLKIAKVWGGYQALGVDEGSCIESGDIFNAERLQGVTFKRGKRIIVIGNHSNAKNDGFYSLYDFGLGKNFSKTRVRIKIEYEAGNERLDDIFDLKPNKDGYKTIGIKVWKKIMEAFAEPFDGSTRKYFTPHNAERMFFKPNVNSEKRHYNPSASAKSDWGDEWIKECKICMSYHDKDAKCPKRDCSKCGQQLYVSTCTDKKCTYKCKKCEKNHSEDKCDKDKCSICGELDDNCNICEECTSHFDDYMNCKCPCNKCDIIFDSNGKCECPPTPLPDPEPWPDPEPDPDYGTKMSIEYYPDNKENCIKVINKIMENANLSINEL